MNPNDATNEELRDWLATKQGYTKINGRWHHPEYHGAGVPGHIIPNTIDAAAKCLPEGWTECWNVDTRFAFRTLNDDGEEQQVNIARTADEATDRFRLAVKAIQAMEDGNGS